MATLQVDASATRGAQGLPFLDTPRGQS